jgi:hypothetical protein
MKYRWILLALFSIPTFLYADSGIEIKSAGGVSEGTDVGFANIIATSIQVDSGSAAAPSIDVGGGNDGFFEQLGVIRISIGGSAGNDVVFGLSGVESANTHGPLMLNSEVSTATNPVWTFIGDDNTGIGGEINQVSIITNGSESIRIDTDTTAGNTRFMLYDVDNATLERVTVGAADSGGAGFKVLRIPN